MRLFSTAGIQGEFPHGSCHWVNFVPAEYPLRLLVRFFRGWIPRYSVHAKEEQMSIICRRQGGGLRNYCHGEMARFKFSGCSLARMAGLMVAE